MRARFAGYTVKMPGHPLLRIGLGVVLVIFGFLGFLPVLGFWMVPLGLAILAVDVPPVRRFYRRMTVRIGGWIHRRAPRYARHFGFGQPRPGKHD
jgi:hypothetical protein